MSGPAREDDLLIRAVRVLETLAGMEQPAPLAAVVVRAGLPRTQVYRALRALQELGWVDHNNREGYRVGTRGLSLGTLLSSHAALRELARPVLVRLADLTTTIATFHLRSGNDRVLTLVAVPPRRNGQPQPPAVLLGERSSLVHGCSGRAILAHLPVGERELILEANIAPWDVTGLRRELSDIVRDGYALSFSENHENLNGLSIALMTDETPGPLGSLSLSGMADQLPEEALTRLVPPLTHASRQLTPRLASMIGPSASTRKPPLDVSPLTRPTTAKPSP